MLKMWFGHCTCTSALYCGAGNELHGIYSLVLNHTGTSEHAIVEDRDITHISHVASQPMHTWKSIMCKPSFICQTALQHVLAAGETAQHHRPMLMTMSRGYILFLSLPILGCSPRPLNKPGGSTRKLPTWHKHSLDVQDRPGC